jgi:uncharacterized membrane protein
MRPWAGVLLPLYLPALVVAFVITVVEMTEVVALVYALSAEHQTIAHGAYGAVSGTTVVALIALGFGAAIVAFPRQYLLWASALLLLAFGVFLFRSTVRTYRRARAAGAPRAAPPPSAKRDAAQFAGGFSVGAVEATETVVVLVALAAAGYGVSALVGALLGGTVLVVAAVLVHERIRRIKVPTLKLGATSMLFTFAVFWTGEAVGFSWPRGDLALIPLFVVALLIVRGAIAIVVPPTVPFEAKG